MTAENIIDGTLPLLKQLKIGDDSAESNAILLSYLNLAKNEIAQDALLWLDGEQVALTTGTNLYTLSTIPIQILDVYDSTSNTVYYRNSPEQYGYFQTTPKKIHVNNPATGITLNVNYYYTPDDYIISDEVVIPNGLINAMQYFIAHKAFDIYKDEKEIITSREYYTKYQNSMQKFLSQTDNNNVDTVLNIDRIKTKGLV